MNLKPCPFCGSHDVAIMRECGFLLAEEYGRTWLAYRRKPAEGGNGKEDTPK